MTRPSVQPADLGTRAVPATTEPTLETVPFDEAATAAPTDPTVPAGGVRANAIAPTRRKRRGRIAFWLAVGWLAAVLFAAVLADLLPLHPYDQLTGLRPRTAPRLSFEEALGTDGFGRSVVSRLVYGARQSLIVGLFSVCIAMTLGMTVGMAAGYFAGKTDRAISVVLDAILSIPALVLLLAIASVGSRSVPSIVIALGLVGIPTFARLSRANTLAIAGREHVQAARAMGARHGRILLREILPHIVFPVSSFAFIWMGIVIVAEGSLSFLGLGIPPPSPSWGGMINDGRPYLASHALLVYIPAACLVFTVVSFTVIGDRARRHFDDVTVR